MTSRLLLRYFRRDVPDQDTSAGQLLASSPCDTLQRASCASSLACPEPRAPGGPVAAGNSEPPPVLDPIPASSPTAPKPASKQRMRRTQTYIEPPAAVLNGHVTSVTSSLNIRVLQTIEAAKRYLFSIQQEDGHWVGELEGDTILETEYA